MTSVQPIDKGAIKFKLIFHNTKKEYWIDPPIGWDKMPIIIKRGDKYSRRILFAEDKEVEFRAHRPVKLGHQFDVMKLHHSLYGIQCFIELVVYVDESIFMQAELDFKTVITDRENYFKTKLIVNDLNKIVDDLEDTKVSIFGDESLNGNYNAPAISDNVILMPKKIRERTKHEIGNPDNKLLENDLISYSRNQVNILLPFGYVQTNESNVGNSYYVNSEDGQGLALTDTTLIYLPVGIFNNISNLKFIAGSDIELKFENIHVEVSGNNVNNSNTKIQMRIAVITYSDESFVDAINSHYVYVKDVQGKEAVINENINIEVPKFTRLVYDIRVISSGISSFQQGKITVRKGGFIIADTIGIYPPTAAKMSRLIHVGEKILSNYSEGQSQITAPRFYQKGEFWWHYITSGSFIRGFTDSSFDLSFKDWKEFIQNAFNCDVQINGNNVFIGKHEDFYIDKEIARFEFKPATDNYEVIFNDELIVNNLKIAYEKFEDDKKETLDAFHTESEWYIPNRIKGELSIELGFTADGYSIEYARREGIDAEPTTAKQKDDDVYIIDCMINKIFVPPVPPFIEGGFFDILQNRQNQGFEYVNNIFSPETAYNLRLSLKRLLLDHYSYRISEIGQKLNNGIPANDTVFLRNTYFKSNGELHTSSSPELQTYNSPLKDNENVTLTNLMQPLIINEIFNFKLSMRIKYNELISLYNRVINERGYVTMTSPTRTLKFYPFDMSYDWIKEELTFKGERKYEI